MRIIACLLPLSLVCALAEEHLKPVTQSQALKLGVEKLTKFTNESESGVDQAARLYATAKRIETEGALAKVNLAQVMELASWREQINTCMDSCCALAYGYFGGGTMYSHAASRNDAEIEDFLAKFAKKLPYPEGSESAEVVKTIDEAIQFTTALALSDDAKLNGDDAEANFNKAKEEVIGNFKSLKFSLATLPSSTALKVAEMATSDLSWIKAEETTEEKKEK